jgi:hypothetical protein
MIHGFPWEYRSHYPVLRSGTVVIGGDVHELEEFLIRESWKGWDVISFSPSSRVTIKTPTQGLLTVAYGARS